MSADASFAKRPSLVISLDFELFWGVADSKALNGYRRNVEGEWTAIPRMLALFRRYDVKATWATVGMAMCRDYGQWRALRPARLPGYARRRCSTYSLDDVVRDNPKLFFARPLAQAILETPGQELASHTYSHFYCAEEGATPEQFADDLACAQAIAGELGARCRSLVFPRNQVLEKFLGVLAGAGIEVYRGNPDHWLYRAGHAAPYGLAGRTIRGADSWLPLSGTPVSRPRAGRDALVDVPASLFLRPWSSRTAMLDALRLARLKRVMNAAARSGEVCHLWWHPHNLGADIDQNLKTLESLLAHFQSLRDRYGMQSAAMRDFSLAGRT